MTRTDGHYSDLPSCQQYSPAANAVVTRISRLMHKVANGNVE